MTFFNEIYVAFKIRKKISVLTDRMKIAGDSM